MAQEKVKTLSVTLRINDGTKRYFRTLADNDRRSLTSYISIYLENAYKLALQRRDSVAVWCSQWDSADDVPCAHSETLCSPCPPPTQEHDNHPTNPLEDDFIPVSKS
jgi:hypothetical protein